MLYLIVGMVAVIALATIDSPTNLAMKLYNNAITPSAVSNVVL